MRFGNRGRENIVGYSVLLVLVACLSTACQGIPNATKTPTVESKESVESRLVEQAKSRLTAPTSSLCNNEAYSYRASMADAFGMLLADPDSHSFSLYERVEILNKAIQRLDKELPESIGYEGWDSGYIALHEGGTEAGFLVTVRVNCSAGSHQDPGSVVYIFNEAGEFWLVGHLTHMREIHWLGDSWIVWADTLRSGPYASAIWHIRQSDGEWVNHVLIKTEPFLTMQDLQVEDDFHRLAVSSHATGDICSVPTGDPTDPFVIITGSRKHTFVRVDEDYLLVDTVITIEEVYFTRNGERIESDWLEQYWQEYCEDWAQP
jgi:hypothetical protein